MAVIPKLFKTCHNNRLIRFRFETKRHLHGGLFKCLIYKKKLVLQTTNPVTFTHIL